MPEGFDSRAMLAKIRRMLDRAEDSRLPPGERANANNLAMHFAKRYNIDLAVARARQKIIPVTSIIDRIFEVNRPFQQQKQLAHVVYSHFGCQLLTIGHDRTERGKLHAFGYEADMELADLLFTSVVLQASSGAQRAYREYVKNFKPWSCKECGHKGYAAVPMDEGWYYCTNCHEEFASHGHTPAVIPERRSTWYRSYWHEYTQVVFGRLQNQDRVVRTEMATESSDGGQGAAIALRDREKQVRGRMEQRYGDIRKGRRTRRGPSGGGREAGRRDGQRADLGTGKLSTGESREISK